MLLKEFSLAATAISRFLPLKKLAPTRYDLLDTGDTRRNVGGVKLIAILQSNRQRQPFIGARGRLSKEEFDRRSPFTPDVVHELPLQLPAGSTGTKGALGSDQLCSSAPHFQPCI